MADLSPVSPDEISARLPEQFFLKRRLRLHEESFSSVCETSCNYIQILARAETFSFPEPTICSVSGGIVRLWYQPLPDVVKFKTSGSACLIR